MGFWKSLLHAVAAPVKALNPANYTHGNPLKNIFTPSGSLNPLDAFDVSNSDNILQYLPYVGDKITADKNMQLQRETNALNYQMFQEGNSFNERMALEAFKRESQYNSAAAEVARLRQAGISPAVSFGDSSGASASAPSSVSPPEMVAPRDSFSSSEVFDSTLKGIVDGKNLQVLNSVLAGNNVDNETRRLLLEDLKVTLGLDRTSKELSQDEMRERIKNYQDERRQREFDRQMKQNQFDLEKIDQRFREKQWKDQLDQFNQKMKLESERLSVERSKVANDSRALDHQEQANKRQYLQTFNKNLQDYCMKLRQFGLEKKKIKLASRQLILNLKRAYPNRYTADDFDRTLKYFDKYVEDL